MSEVKHTPTPWEAQPIDADKSAGGDIGAACIVGSNLGGLVAAALPWPTEIDSGDFSRVKANAAFVVRAINSHEPMLKALKEARAMLQVVSLDDADEDYSASWNKGVAEIDAAIAAAGDA